MGRDLDETLNLDAEKTTRTIERLRILDEINEMFDEDLYGRSWRCDRDGRGTICEKEVFGRGTYNYLAAHLYGNATAEDFWNAQTANSHLPVDKIMSSFVTEAGVPLLTLSERQGSGVPVAQSRFFLSGLMKRGFDYAEQRWTVPVCPEDRCGVPICRVIKPEDWLRSGFRWISGLLDVICHRRG